MENAHDAIGEEAVEHGLDREGAAGTGQAVSRVGGFSI